MDGERYLEKPPGSNHFMMMTDQGLGARPSKEEIEFFHKLDMKEFIWSLREEDLTVENNQLDKSDAQADESRRREKFQITALCITSVVSEKVKVKWLVREDDDDESDTDYLPIQGIETIALQKESSLLSESVHVKLDKNDAEYDEARKKEKHQAATNFFRDMVGTEGLICVEGDSNVNKKVKESRNKVILII